MVDVQHVLSAVANIVESHFIENMNFKITTLLFCVLCALITPEMAKRKLSSPRNEARKLKRRATALMKKRMIEQQAQQRRLENQRERKAKSRLKKFREHIKIR